MKTFLKVIGIILGILVLIVGSGVLFLKSGMDRTEAVTLQGKTAAGLKDGIYEGQYAGGRFSNTIHVTVKKEAILEVNVIKPALIEKPEFRESFTATVLNAQGTDVDAQTGATLSTKAYLMSIENALSSEPLTQ